MILLRIHVVILINKLCLKDKNSKQSICKKYSNYWRSITYWTNNLIYFYFFTDDDFFTDIVMMSASFKTSHSEFVSYLWLFRLKGFLRFKGIFRFKLDLKACEQANFHFNNSVLCTNFLHNGNSSKFPPTKWVHWIQLNWILQSCVTQICLQSLWYFLFLHYTLNLLLIINKYTHCRTM